MVKLIKDINTRDTQAAQTHHQTIARTPRAIQGGGGGASVPRAHGRRASPGAGVPEPHG